MTCGHHSFPVLKVATRFFQRLTIRWEGTLGTALSRQTSWQEAHETTKKTHKGYRSTRTLYISTPNKKSAHCVHI